MPENMQPREWQEDTLAAKVLPGIKHLQNIWKSRYLILSDLDPNQEAALIIRRLDHSDRKRLEEDTTGDFAYAIASQWLQEQKARITPQILPKEVSPPQAAAGSP